MSEPLHIPFLVLAVVCAVSALLASDLLATVVLLAAFSFFSAMYFASVGALDVAFTEAAVGAAITGVLLVTAVFRTERRALLNWSGAGPRARWLALPGLALVAGALALALVALPPVGDPNAPPMIHVAPRYIESGLRETGAPNLVTGVLADYRAYDTLGETAVIVTAGLAALLVLGDPRGLRR